MEPLIIPPTEITPKIHFDTDRCVRGKYIFEISGESRPENVTQFYNPVIDWLEKYKLELLALKSKTDYVKKIKIRFKFRLDFFNSGSAKCFFDILQKLEEINNIHSMADVKVIWIYDNEDEDIYDAGEELKTMTKVPFQLSLLRIGETVKN